MAKLEYSQGFTLVEVVVTLLVASVLTIGIISIQSEVSTLSALEMQHTTASYLAYDNMRSYANDAPPSWFDCTNSSPGAVSQVLIQKSGTVEGLPGTVEQTVVATAPYGCGGATVEGLGMPIRIESKVRYGGDREVVHATYAAF